jgi:hypothetical protein
MPKPHTRVFWKEDADVLTLCLGREDDVPLIELRKVGNHGWQAHAPNPVLGLSQGYLNDVIEGMGPAKRKALEVVSSNLFSLYEKLTSI